MPVPCLAVCSGKIGLESDHLAALGGRLLLLSLRSQGVAEAGVGPDEVWLEADGLAVLGDRLLLPPQGGQNVAEAVMGYSIVGFLADGLAKRGDCGVENGVGLLAPPRGLERPAEATEMTYVAAPKPGEVLKYGNCLVRLSLGLQGVCQTMGSLGSDRAGGRVIADRLLPPPQFFQTQRQVVVEPDVAGITALGPAPRARSGAI
jgi:hypothetical protein